MDSEGCGELYSLSSWYEWIWEYRSVATMAVEEFVEHATTEYTERCAKRGVDLILEWQKGLTFDLTFTAENLGVAKPYTEYTTEVLTLDSIDELDILVSEGCSEVYEMLNEGDYYD
jgi:hypothetical protein